MNGVGGKPLTGGKAIGFILFAWTYAVGWSIPPFFGWGKYIPEGNFFIIIIFLHSVFK